MIKLAIILVNYNGLNDTLECIQSINNSKHENAEITIIVVDNNSRTNDIKVINKQYPDVVTIQNEINMGFAGANNIGILHALKCNCEWIMLLNNDTVIDKNMIENMLKESKECPIVVPLMLYYSDPEKIWYAGGKISKFTGNNYHYKMNKYTNSVALKKINCTFATGCCMMIHRKIFKDVGFFNDSYFMYCEDTEFSIRLNLKKYKILFTPDAVLWHKISSSSGGSMSPFSIYYCTRNRLTYLREYKAYFSKFAFLFSYITRLIRMYQCKFRNDDERFFAFQKGLDDFRKKVKGCNFN